MDRRKLSVGKVFRFTFTGWKAWAVLAVIIALAFTRYQMIHGGLPEALAQIKPFLKGSYIRQAIAERGTERARDPFPKFEVTFAEAEVRGVFSPRPVVRVKPLVNGGPPPTAGSTAITSWSFPSSPATTPPSKPARGPGGSGSSDWRYSPLLRNDT